MSLANLGIERGFQCIEIFFLKIFYAKVIRVRSLIGRLPQTVRGFGIHMVNILILNNVLIMQDFKMLVSASSALTYLKL